MVDLTVPTVQSVLQDPTHAAGQIGQLRLPGYPGRASASHFSSAPSPGPRTPSYTCSPLFPTSTASYNQTARYHRLDNSLISNAASAGVAAFDRSTKEGRTGRAGNRPILVSFFVVWVQPNHSRASDSVSCRIVQTLSAALGRSQHCTFLIPSLALQPTAKPTRPSVLGLGSG